MLNENEFSAANTPLLSACPAPFWPSETLLLMIWTFYCTKISVSVIHCLSRSLLLDENSSLWPGSDGGAAGPQWRQEILRKLAETYGSNVPGQTPNEDTLEMELNDILEPSTGKASPLDMKLNDIIGSMLPLHHRSSCDSLKPPVSGKWIVNTPHGA